ncbi:MAG TPA: OmpH family outer membrane protein [Caulobacteraceae bacterium]|jgi:outer membrane protein|nr:OmpH family outer membrane protein [Caulobacteraceae bacterium]
MKTALTLALAASTAFAITAAASAQTTGGVTPNTGPASSGPAIPGVCVFSNEVAVSQSAVGVSMVTRLKQIAATTDAELNQAGSQVQNEQTALQAAKASLSPDQLQQKGQLLQAHYEAFLRLRQQRSEEFQETQKQQIQRIDAAIEPLLKTVADEHRCGLMLNAGATYGFSNAMDVTKPVIDRLNGVMTTISFDRVHLDQQQGGAPVAAAAPAPVATHRKK